MSDSIELLFDLPFFISELLKWISIQEIGRLKCTCKKIQSKLTIQTIRPILEQFQIFKSLIFRNQLEIIEQIIPFKFNNNSKITRLLNPKIYEFLSIKAATQNREKLLMLLISTECLEQFGDVNCREIISSCADFGHLSLAKRFIKQIQSLNNPNLKINESEFDKLLYIAFSNNDRKLIEWCLEQSSNPDKHKLLKEIINLTRKSCSKDLNWIEHTYYISSLYYLNPKISDCFEAVKELFDNEDKFNSVFQTLRNLDPFQNGYLDQNRKELFSFLPNFELIAKFSKIPATLEFSKRLTSMLLHWSVFCNDIEEFNIHATNTLQFKISAWPLKFIIGSETLLARVVHRMIDRNISSRFLEICLENMKVGIEQRASYLMRESVCDCLYYAFKHKRIDIYDPILKYLWENGSQWPQMVSAILVRISLCDDLELCKTFISKYCRPTQIFSSIVHPALYYSISGGNVEMVKYLLSFCDSEIEDAWIESVLDNGNLDLYNILMTAKENPKNKDIWSELFPEEAQN